MSLLRDVQDMASNPKVRVHQLLLKGQILAARLGHAEFGRWIELELDGYPKEVDLPEYRTGFRQIIKATFAGPFGKVITNAQVPAAAVPREARFFFDDFDIRYPISSIEQFANMPDAAIRVALPAELPQMVSYYEDMNCVEVWAEQPRHGYARILEAVREKLLRYALEIERTNPRAGEAAPGETPIPRQRLREIQNIILGGTNVVSAGDAFQYVINVKPGDLASLEAELRRLGLNDGGIDELRTAVKADGTVRDRKLGERVRAWLGKAAEMTATGAWTVAAGAGSQVLADAVLRYYGVK